MTAHEVSAIEKKWRGKAAGCSDASAFAGGAYISVHKFEWLEAVETIMQLVNEIERMKGAA